MGFYRESLVKSVRKPRACSGCATMIEIGQPALNCAGHYDGDFWAADYHPECRAAENALNDLHGAEEWMQLSEIEWEDYPWLIADHPIVAERMKITQESYDEIAAKQEFIRVQRWFTLHGFTK